MGGGGWEAEGGNHLDSSSSVVPSLWDQNWYNPQGGPRLPLGEAWYPHAVPVMPLRAEKCILVV